MDGNEQVRDALDRLRRREAGRIPEYQGDEDDPDGHGWGKDAQTVVRFLLALASAGPLFRVRGLEWEPATHIREHARTLFGTFDVELFPECYAWRPPNGTWEPCYSLEDGKAKAEAWYRAKLAAALEPVPC